MTSWERSTGKWTAGRRRSRAVRKAVTIQATLVKQYPIRSSYGLWMATFRIAPGDALLRRNQPVEARTSNSEEGISMLLHQVAQIAVLRVADDVLALGYSRLAIALRQTGERDRAEEAARKAEQERNAVRRFNGSP